MQSKFQKLIIDIKVSDLTRAVGFYKDTLGLPLIRRTGDWASFEVAGAEIHLFLNGGATEGVEFRVKNIEAVFQALKAGGVVFKTSAIEQFSWGKIAKFQDSEGNTLALVED